MKPYWQMMLTEYLASGVSLEYRNRQAHRAIVQDALSRRRDVPGEVLADYPGLTDWRKP